MADRLIRLSDVLAELDRHAKGSVQLGGQSFRTIQLHEAETAINALPAAAPTVQEARPAVRVKPLVWERLSSGTLRADIYRVKSTYGMGPKAFILVRASIVLGHFDDDVSAMAVGDADHEAHILAAVEAVDLRPVREALIHARNQIQHPDQLIDEAIALIDGENGNG